MDTLLNKKGFTLMELILVIGIISIISSIVMININSQQDVLLKSYAEQLVQDIRRIRTKTIYEKNTQYRILFHNNGYRILLNLNTLEKVEFDNNITLAGYYVGKNLSFGLDGTPVPPGNITLRNKRGKEMQIRVEFSTGRVRMYK